LSVLPWFVAVPTDVTSIFASGDGRRAALIHGEGRKVSVVDLVSSTVHAVGGDYSRIDGVSFLESRLVVSDGGTLRIFDPDTREAKGTIRTGQEAVYNLWTAPGDSEFGYAVASDTRGEAGQVLYLDLKRRTSKPVNWIGQINVSGHASVHPLSLHAEFLILGGGVGTRIVLNGENGTVVETAQLYPRAVYDGTRNVIYVIGLGLFSVNDLSMKYAASPKPRQLLYTVPLVWVGSNLLLALFDGYGVGFLDGWGGEDVGSVTVREAPSDSFAQPMHSGRPALKSAGGSVLLACAGGRLYRVEVPDLKNSFPATKYGRFKELPASLEVEPGGSFQFTAEVVGLGKGASYFLKNNPKDMKLNETTGQINWTAPGDFKEPVIVQIGAKDDAELEASLRFMLYPKSGK
jgi:hypothetical protein